MTVTELSNEFLDRYCMKRLRPSTIRGYWTNLEKHINPYIGQKNIAELIPDDLDDLTELLQEKGLKNKSIVYVHATLRKALNYAIKRDYIVRNVYDRFDLPRIEDYPYTVLTQEQMTTMLYHARGLAPLDLAITLALRYGLRRGEVLGVIPQTDIDFSQNVLHVQRTRGIENGKETVTPCKTKSSNRYILLTPEDAVRFRGVPPGMYSVPYTPTQLEKRFKQFLKLHGYSAIRIHDLRHTYATYMLSKGVNPKIVSAVLGHSGVAITLNIYSHPDVSMQKQCLEVLP